MDNKYSLRFLLKCTHRLIDICCFLALGVFSFGAIAGVEYSANDQDDTPFSPAIIQPLESFNGQPVELVPMSPNFRNYLNDVGNEKPNFYTTKTNIGTSGKVPVWIAYEVFGVTLDDLGTGGVVLRTDLWGPNKNKASEESLMLSVINSSSNTVIIGQAMILRDFITHPNQNWLSQNIRNIFGDNAFNTFLERLTIKGANRRILMIRHYEVEGGKPLGIEVGFDKGDRFVPMAVRVSVGTKQQDLDHLFVKGTDGNYTYPSTTQPPWYKRYKGVLILVFLIVIAVIARAVLSNRR